MNRTTQGSKAISSQLCFLIRFDISSKIQIIWAQKFKQKQVIS